MTFTLRHGDHHAYKNLSNFFIPKILLRCIYTDGNILLRKPIMKMHSSTIDVQSTGIISQSTAKCKERNLGILFDIARKKIYTNKPLAIIREYCTNAYDAHVDAGIKDTPIEVSFPTPFKSTLTIRDFGKGLSEADMYGIFFEYAESTKRDTNNQVGMLGLGSKSAFCYADEYFITSYHNGIKSSYHAFIDDARLGTIAKMHEEPTTETGLQIDVEIKSGDLSVFRSIAGNFLCEFDPKPIIKNDDYVVNTLQKEQSKNFIIKNDTYSIHRDWRNPDHMVRMGNVNYKFTLGDLGLSDYDRNTFGAFENNYVKIYAEIGDVTPSASREHLEMDDRTKSFIVSKFESILTDITKDAQDTLNKCQSFYEFAIEFEKMRQTIYSFKLKIDYNGKTYISSDTPHMNTGQYKSILMAEEYANYNRKKAFKQTTKIQPSNEQLYFTYAGDVSKATVKQRLLQSSYEMRNAYILSFNDKSDRDELVNHPDWKGATFIDVASLSYVSPKKSSQYHSMVKSDVYRFNEGYSTKHLTWTTEEKALANSDGVYVEMNRFIPKFRRPDLIETSSIDEFNELLRAFHNLGFHVPIIYGIKSSDIKKLGDGWVSLESYLNKQIREMSDEKIERMNSLLISRCINSNWNKFFASGMETTTDNEKRLKEIVLKHFNRLTMTISRGEHLQHLIYRGYKFDLSLFEETNSLIDEMLDNHPMLKLLFGYIDTFPDANKYYGIVNDYIMGK